METNDFFDSGLIKEHSEMIEKDVFQASVATLIVNHKHMINSELITRLDDIEFIENNEIKNNEINRFFEEIMEHKKSIQEYDDSETLII
jgi:hypothetical protein